MSRAYLMPNNYMICSRILHAHVLYLFIWLKVTFLSLLANNYILNIVHYLGYQCLCIQSLSHCPIAYSDQNFVLLLCMCILYMQNAWRKEEMFHLMTHSAYFIFWVCHQTFKNHWDKEETHFGEKDHWIFYMHHPTARIAHTMVFVIPVMEHEVIAQ